MIPSDKVQNIINKYVSLEKELSAGKFDAKQFAKKSNHPDDFTNSISNKNSCVTSPTSFSP